MDAAVAASIFFASQKAINIPDQQVKSSLMTRSDLIAALASVLRSSLRAATSIKKTRRIDRVFFVQ